MSKLTFNQTFHGTVGQVINAETVTINQGASAQELVQALEALRQLLPVNHAHAADILEVQSAIASTDAHPDQSKLQRLLGWLKNVKEGTETIEATVATSEKIKTAAVSAYTALLTYAPQLQACLNSLGSP